MRVLLLDFVAVGADYNELLPMGGEGQANFYSYN